MVALTQAGRNFIAQAIANIDSPDHFDAANAHIGVGDSDTAFADSQTDLQAAVNKIRKSMLSGYPQRSGNIIHWRSVFGTSEANWTWREWAIFNAASDGTMLARVLEDLGTKSSGQSWQLTVLLTLLIKGSESITHGSQLTHEDTGYWALGIDEEDLAYLSPHSEEWFYRLNDPFEFITDQEYVYNDDPENKGGVVPEGGVTIDGYDVPEGAYVLQFTDFSDTAFNMTGFSETAKSYVFRGCKGRNTSPNIGFWNCQTAFTGKLFVLHCDLGGLGGHAEGDYHEIPLMVAATSGCTGLVAYRNRIRNCTTGIQPNRPNCEVTENMISDLSTFGTEAHLNGLSLSGGQPNMLLLRNHIVLNSPDAEGRPVTQTDAIAFFQDFGEFPGDGTNRDGTPGYEVNSNYLGGGAYTIYAGKNPGSEPDSVNNMRLKNNLITTSVWPNGGEQGVLTAAPTFGELGNLATNNRWADGDNVGELAFGSA